jgi:phosphatidylglycerol lysyltransferase
MLRGRVHPAVSSVAPAHLFNTLALIAGLTLLYLGFNLRRQKRTAWVVALALYGTLAAWGCVRLAAGLGDTPPFTIFTHDILLPAAIVSVLLADRSLFHVKSDVRSFAVALRFSLLVMLIALAYGVLGFMLLDEHDFHRDINLGGALQHTIDQFGLTTGHELVPYTRRARTFMVSLPVISIGAMAYALVSLFQPLRARLTDQSAHREWTEDLLRRFPASSEDFFKLWPHDKMYFFNGARSSGLAYSVRGGVALVVGDPFGDAKNFDALLDDFDDFCRINDWTAAYVHTEPAFSELYRRHGLSLQKIGEEAVLDLAKFEEHVRRNKYFRQITNRFTKQGYTCEVLEAPYSSELITALHGISDQWLSLPGRAERGFMMGSFSEAYMQQSTLIVLRDADGAIQGFLNQIPSFDPKEANFDLLRHSPSALGNSNDFMLLAFITHAKEHGFERLNLGLCPLSGFDNKENKEGDGDGEHTVIDSALRFLYANGDRFYSFSGLRRFKSKYEPDWQGRYIAYRGGLRGFTRALNALYKAMKIPK